MNILLLCTGNSCRSQMAHGFLEKKFGKTANIYSAGVEAHGVNPKSILVMREVGIDISNNTSNTMNEYIEVPFNYIFTLGENAKRNCLNYKGMPKIVHQKFTDPFNVKGTETEVLDIYRKVRDEIIVFFDGFLI